LSSLFLRIKYNQLMRIATIHQRKINHLEKENPD